VTTEEGHAGKRWRGVLRRIGSGGLLGWVLLGGVFLVMGLYGLAAGDATWYMLVPGPDVAAVALNACTWVAALAFGRTRQLRSSWLALAAIIAALQAAAILWPKTWGQDLGTIAFWAVIGLGFPTNLVMVLLLALVEKIPGYPGNVVDLVALVGSAYLQAFVLLPRLFRWRARAVAAQVESEARSGGSSGSS
jgi:4-amino-4-deoxy-L-arabinose transferase-like glycosyltransferase